MADLDFDFNPAAVEDRPDYGILPVGEYVGEVTESDYLATKKGTGKYIKLTFTIMEGPYVGRKYFDNLNVQNENKQAMDIANATLKELLVAMNITVPFKKTEQLHGIPVLMKVGVSKRKDTGEDQNTVRYKPLSARGQAAPRAAAPAGAPSPAPDAPKKKPWEK